MEDYSTTDRARFEKMDEKERLEEVYKFEKPFPEVNVTPQVRQEGFEAFVTTDDHLMHLTGIAKDLKRHEILYHEELLGNRA